MSQAGRFSSGGGGSGTVVTLTGNSGGPIGPDGSGNINTLGSGDITVVGNAGTHTLTFELTGAVANTYDADTGSATPALGIININGADGIQTSASGNTIIIGTDGDIATTYDADSGSATPSGGILTISGGVGMTTDGSGSTITINLDTPVSIADGGTNSTSMTNTDGVVYFDGTKLNTTTVGTATFVLTSNGAGMAPTFQAASSGGVTSITGDTGTTEAGALNITGGSSGALFDTSSGNITESFRFLKMSDTTSTTGYIQIGADIVFNCYGGVSSNNIFIGQNAGESGVTGTQNVGIGSGPGGSGVMGVITTGSLNTGCGYNSFNNLGMGSSNTAFGGSACAELTSGTTNTAVGQGALSNITSGGYNIAIGSGSASNYSTGNESSNTCIGNEGINGESNVIRIGTQGTGAGQQNVCAIAGIYGSTVGATNAAVFIDSTGTLGTVGGSGGVSSLTGSGGGGALTGALTLAGGSSGAVYTGSGSTITTTFTKINMPYTNSAATQGVIQFAGTDVFGFYGGSGQNNCYLGDTAGNTSISTTGNTGIGASTQFLNTGGTDNTSIGNFSLSGLTSGNFNTGIGASALQNVTTGGTNTCIGFGAGNAFTGSESGNICIGAPGVVSTSNAIHIGDGGTQTTCFIGGIAGVTVSSTAAVLVNTSTNQLGTVISSRRYKENINDLDLHDSKKILDLRPVSFTYIGSDEKQFGLIAEEVEEVMPYLVAYNKLGEPETVRYHELPSLLLKEIQRLNLKIQELEGKFNARVR